MKKKFAQGLLLALAQLALAQESPSTPDTTESSIQFLQCNAIFESRKNEIKDQIRQLDEKNQALQALQNASQNMLNQREKKLKEREEALSIKLKQIQDEEAKLKAQSDERETKLKNLIAKNKQLLEDIDVAKNNKLAQTYAKMKDSKAAPIIENLSDSEAASILFALSPQDMGKILSKMNPKKAAELTEILKKGPPFEDLKTSSKTTPNQSNTQEAQPEIQNQNPDTQADIKNSSI